MSEPLKKFQSLLRELFQFDSADLDFGLYRIMNHKRSVVESFIERDRPKAVRQALAAMKKNAPLKAFIGILAV